MARESWNEDGWGDGPDMSGLLNATLKRSIKSKKGQALLKEMLEAVEASPGLCEDWCEMPKVLNENGEEEDDVEIQEDELYRRANQEGLCDKEVPPDTLMCSIGEMARRRGCGTYGPLVEDLGYGHAHGTIEAAKELGFPEFLAREIAWINDHWGPQGETPLQRKERIIRWLKAKIITQ